MFSPATMLGLNPSRPGLPPAHNRAPYYLIFHFIYAYGVLSSRTLKQYYGIDNNRAPREDIATVGEEAVKSGKITKQQLDMVKRNEAAYHNSVENYTLFVASLLSAHQAGVPNHIINRAALLYTVARFGYAAAYILIEDNKYAIIRSRFWWIGNLSCMFLLWKAGRLFAL